MQAIHNFVAIIKKFLKIFWIKKCNKNYQVPGYVIQIFICSSVLLAMLQLVGTYIQYLNCKILHGGTLLQT